MTISEQHLNNRSNRKTMLRGALVSTIFAAEIGTSTAFVAPIGHAIAAPAASTALEAKLSSEHPASENVHSRRSAIAKLLTTTVATASAAALFPNEAFAEAETLERGGVKLTPFNSLAFNYRGK